MPKVSVELIHEVLSNNSLEPETIQKVLQQIEEQAAAELEAEKANQEPTVKKQLVLLISDPRGLIPDHDFVGWAFKIPEDDTPILALEKLIRASYEYNISKKGRKYPVKSVGEACEAVGSRFLKEQGLSVLNKVPVTILKTDNKIPEIESDF